MTLGSFHSRFFRCAAAALAAGFCAPAIAQPVWVISNAGVYLEVDTYANDFGNDFSPLDLLGLGKRDNQSTSTLIAGFNGLNYGQRLQSYVADENFFATPNTYCSSTAVAEVSIDGENTIELEMRWKILSDNQAFAPEEFEAEALSRMSDAPNLVDFFVELNTTGVPNGTPLIIYFYWDVSAGGFTRDEGPGLSRPFPPDYSAVSATSLEVNGQDLLNGTFNFDIQDPVVSVNYNLKNQGGQINTTAGTPITIRVRGEVESGIYALGAGAQFAEDGANAHFKGRFRISVGTPPIPGPPGGVASLGPSIPNFSVDIGGDTELSSLLGPPGSGLEVFDPGDVYQWQGPALPPGGANGFLDDALALTFDQNPIPMMVPPTQAPICSGPMLPSDVPLFFDLDGHDLIDFSLIGLIDPIAPLPSPIVMGTLSSTCLFGAEFLFISYDDDAPDPYNECEVPNNSLSPGGRMYGDSVERDEIIGITIHPVAPAPVIGIYPIAAEEDVHISLAPNPDGIFEFDDDVDSLDIPLDDLVCTTWLFSSDHEAPGFNPLFPGIIPLNPGAIYEVVPGGPPVQVIDPQIHLGLQIGTDVGDFELVWMEDTLTGTGAISLALIFCVHSDNPTTTAVDESGGLDPRMLYYSFLTGSSHLLLTGPLSDAIDAVASFQHSLAPVNPFTPPCCLGDADGSLQVDFGDINAVIANWGTGGPGGDANCDGIIDFSDITEVIANWGNTCP